MKISLVLIGLLLGTTAFAANPEDVSGCKGAAVKSAINYARNLFSTQIRYTNGSVLKVVGRGQSVVSIYTIGLEHCDSQSCGGLTFDVAVQGKKPNCSVLEAELVGEE